MSEKKKSFEEKLKRVEEIVKEIEGSELDLEKSLSLFSEGHLLISELESELKEAQAKVVTLINKDGKETDF